MKKIYLLMLTGLLALLFSVPLFAADELQVEPTRFLCRSFASESASLFAQEDGSLIVSFRSGAPILELREPDLTGAETCNAIRVVLKNNSTCNSLVFLYTVDGEEQKMNIPIARRSGKTEYFLYPKDIQTISDLSLSFSGAYSGTVELYSVEAVSVYDDSASEPGSILDCVYDFANKKIRISGTVSHDIAVNTRDAVVELYAFGMDETVTNLKISNASPIASTSLSVRFEFEVPEVFFTDRFLQYVVAIMSPEGRVLYVYTPRCPCVEVADDGEEALPFKGVYTECSVLAVGADTGLAVVDVYLDRLQSQKNNGLLHIVDGRYFYIDRSYIYELDDVIGQYGADGCLVYLRFLLSGDNGYTVLHSNGATSSEATYYGISLTGDTARLTLFAYTDFLCERYADEKNGTVDGIVLGRAVDHAAEYNYVGDLVLADYTEIYGNALYILSQATRKDGRNMDIVVPVTDLLNGGQSELPEGRYPSGLFLTSLCKLIDDRFGNGLTVRVMVEGTAVPDRLLSENVDADVVSAENIDGFKTLFQSLSSTYGRIKDGYLYYWMPESGLGADRLSDAYVYTYYKLSVEGAAGVILSTERLGTETELESLFDTVKYVDTQWGLEKNAATLSAFGESEWTALIPHWEPSTVAKRNVFVYEDYTVPSSDIQGSYILWDYRQGRSTYDWKTYGGGSISVEDVDSYGRALVARLTPSSAQAGYSELIYAYSATEIMSAVDMLSVDILIDGGEGQSYQLIFEICGDRSSCVVSATVESGVSATVYLSTLRLDKNDPVRNIRIFSAPTEGNEEYRLCVGRLAAHSSSLDDEALEKENVRTRLASATEEEDGVNTHSAVWQGGVMLLVVLLCVSAFIVFALARKGE